MNFVVLVGRLTNDPLVANTENKHKTLFGLATNEFRGGQQAAEYHNCVAWDQLADIIATHAKKGRLVELTGRLHTYEGRNRDGVTSKRTEIVVNTFQFLSAGERGSSEGAPTRSAARRPAAQDDLPW